MFEEGESVRHERQDTAGNRLKIENKMMVDNKQNWRTEKKIAFKKESMSDERTTKRFTFTLDTNSQRQPLKSSDRGLFMKEQKALLSFKGGFQ